MVTGAFARAFRSAVQPMEIAAALQREVDNSAQILSRDRRLAPNDFTIDLSGSDFDRLSTYGDTLSRELAAMLHEHAQEQHYMFAGPISSSTSPAPTTSPPAGSGYAARLLPRFRLRPAPERDRHHDLAGARSSSRSAALRHPLEAPGLRSDAAATPTSASTTPASRRRHVEFRVAGTDERHAVGQRGRPRLDQRHPGQRPARPARRVDDGSVVQVGSTRIVVHVGGRPRVVAGPSEQSGRRRPRPRRPAPTTGPGTHRGSSEQSPTRRTSRRPAHPVAAPDREQPPSPQRPWSG